MCIYLVPQSLAGNYGNLIANLFVDLKIEGQSRIITLDNDLCRLLHCFRSNTTHDGDLIFDTLYCDTRVDCGKAFVQFWCAWISLLPRLA